MADQNTLDITNETKRFKQFLDIPENDRIIFSGIFGCGKTYFLEKIFEQHQDEYVCIHLYPTNYSVSSNEDIFEYIKYDILYDLLDKEIVLQKDNISSLNAIQSLTAQEIFELFKVFVKAVPEIGKKVVDLLKPLESLATLISEKKAEARDDGESIKEFAEKFQTKIGSLYESDFYTNLISEYIEQLKNSGKKEVVLIIDDLDRIDPEHIFRILNVFAVHFNVNKTSENKFGINKIILCCDSNNIRSIFRARYGQETDFNGYIDKFYSRNIFHFNNKSIFIYNTKIFLSRLSILRPEPTNQVFSWKGSELHNHFFQQLFISLINSDAINLRTLLKLKNLDYSLLYYKVNFPSISIESFHLPLIQIFDFLTFIYGSHDSVLEALKKTKITYFGSHHSTYTFYKQIILDCCLIGDYKSHRFVDGAKQIYMNTEYEVVKIKYEDYYNCHLPNGIELSIDGAHFVSVLIETFNKYIHLKNSTTEYF